jgi:hypothetical protein
MWRYSKRQCISINLGVVLEQKTESQRNDQHEERLSIKTSRARSHSFHRSKRLLRLLCPARRTTGSATITNGSAFIAPRTPPKVGFSATSVVVSDNPVFLAPQVIAANAGIISGWRQSAQKPLMNALTCRLTRAHTSSATWSAPPRRIGIDLEAVD